MAWENRGHRRCVLDGERAQYTCAIGQHSIENGNFHNVYIRLKAQKHGKMKLLYFFVLLISFGQGDTMIQDYV